MGRCADGASNDLPIAHTAQLPIAHNAQLPAGNTNIYIKIPAVACGQYQYQGIANNQLLTKAPKVLDVSSIHDLLEDLKSKCPTYHIWYD